MNGWINGTTVATGNAQFTNWDRAFNQVTESAQAYDIAVIITDGNPTAYGIPATTQTNGRTRFREVENGIFSANGLKAKGTRIVAFGVGAGVSSSGLNLQLDLRTRRSTPTTSRPPTTRRPARRSRRWRSGSCKGIDLGHQTGHPTGRHHRQRVARVRLDLRGHHATSGVTISPASGVTDATGGVNFNLTFPGGVTTAPGHRDRDPADRLHPRPAGRVQRDLSRIDTDAAVPVTNSGTLGFLVDGRRRRSDQLHRLQPAPRTRRRPCRSTSSGSSTA